MPTRTGPTIRDLTQDQSLALLRRRNVGRIAFSLRDRVDIEPINYVSDGSWIFGRTSKGTKLSTLLHNPWCAFETDEFTDMFEWSSVVVKGAFSLLDPEVGSPDTYRRAEGLLRTLVPGTFTAHDPMPHRDIIFGIFVDTITGKASRHGSGGQ